MVDDQIESIENRILHTEYVVVSEFVQVKMKIMSSNAGLSANSL